MHIVGSAVKQMTVIVQNANVQTAAKKMSSVVLTNNQFNPDGYWATPMSKMLYIPLAEDLDLFDQNGYDLTVLEQHFAMSNDQEIKSHRSHRHAVKKDWFTQERKIEGAVLNHSLLFERKAYAGAALEQLKHWAKKLPLIYKIIAMRPKWGMDFSMDYVDNEGNAFEILHWEYDSFDYEEICVVKEFIELKILSIDWDRAAADLIKYKDKWHHLDFFAQSDWKCDYFGIPKERFKMVIWD